MKLHTFDIPDDPALLPRWLEQHLMGLDLARLVTELGVLGGARDEPSASLAEVLGEQRHGVLHTGLGALAQTQLRRLIRQPQLLLELQRLVLDEGGDYWTTVPASTRQTATSRATWSKVEKALRERPVETVLASMYAASKPWIWAGAGWLCTAAVVLVAILLQRDRAALENRLADQIALADTLRQELRDQQAIALVRAEPADLPGATEFVVHASPDPEDLPGDDPLDLPDHSQPRL